MDMEAIIRERKRERERSNETEIDREKQRLATMEAELNINLTSREPPELRGSMDSYLLEAAKEGDTDILAYANNFCINSYFLSTTPDQQENIIHIAVRAGQFRFVKEALDIFPTLIRSKNVDGDTPVHVAASLGESDIISFLISHLESIGEDDNSGVLAVNVQRDTPFHVALKNGKVEAAATFCRECTQDQIKALFQKPNIDGRTPLHLLALHCCANDFLDDWDSMVGLYNDIFLCADDLRASQDIDGNTPLHLAIQSRNLHAAKLLVKRSLESEERNEITMKNNKGNSVSNLLVPVMLKYDMMKDLKEMVARTKRLLKEQVLVESMMDDVLYKAAVKMDWDVFQGIRRGDRDVEGGSIVRPSDAYFLAQTPDGSNIIHIALQQGKEKEVGFINEALTSFPSLILQADSYGDTPIHLAAKRDNPVSRKYLAVFSSVYEDIQGKHKQGVLAQPWKAKNSKGNMPIHEALRTNNVFAALTLLKKYPKAASFINDVGETPLHVHARCTFFPVDMKDKLFETLISQNVSAAYMRDRDGLTPLLRAAKSGRFRIVRALLEHCPQSAYIRDPDGKTFLHLLRFEGGDVHEHSADQLFKQMGENFFKIPEADAQRLALDSEGDTPLHYAIKTGNSIAAEILTRRCLKTKDQSELMLLNNEGETVLNLLASYDVPNKIVDLIRSAHRDAMYLARSTYGVRKANIKDSAGSLSIIAGLLATITFAAAFQVPGGFDGDSGSPVLLKRAAFQVFMVSDAIAVCSSMLVLFSSLWVMGSGKTYDSFILLDISFFLLQASFYSTLVAFMTGVYAATASTTLWLGICSCVLCAIVVLVSWRSSILFLSKHIRLYIDMLLTVDGCSSARYEEHHRLLHGN